MKATSFVTGLLCAAAATASAGPASPLPGRGSGDAPEHSLVEIKPAGHAFKQLGIENPLGDITVEGYDGDAISVETWKYAPDEDSLDRLRVSLVPNPDGTVAIRTAADGGREVKPIARSAVRLDILIRAPRNTRIEAAVSAGKLTIKDMDAGGDLDTASGPISVANVSGELWTHSVSGRTSIEQAFGSIDAATVSSDVELDTISGDKLVASATKGKIAGRRVRSRDIELTTTDGKIQLEAEMALHGRLVVSSLRGDIDVKLRNHAAVAQVRARGVKVDLAGTAAAERQGEWVQAMLGQAAHPDPAAMAMVELESRLGNVQFTIVQ